MNMDHPSQAKPLTDAALISLVLQGETAYFATLIQRYESKIATTLHAMLGHGAEAEDVGQEVFIRFYRSLSSFRGESSVGTYLTRIAINLALNALKKRKIQQSRFETYDDALPFESKSNISDDVNSLETNEWVEAALGYLDSGIRAVVVMRLIQGYSVKETSEILEIPQGTVLSRLSRGQNQLKTLLTKYR